MVVELVWVVVPVEVIGGAGRVVVGRPEEELVTVTVTVDCGAEVGVRTTT